jgi:hypothetical protein
MQKQEITTYDHHQSPVFYQAQNGTAVTASDSTILNAGVLYVGTGGNVAVTTRGGDNLIFSNVADGSFLPVVVTKVLSTGTTASDILLLY